VPRLVLTVGRRLIRFGTNPFRFGKAGGACMPRQPAAPSPASAGIFLWLVLDRAIRFVVMVVRASSICSPLLAFRI